MPVNVFEERRGARTPRGVALRSEEAPLPRGPGERFAGYGVLSLPFRCGDLLAFRRFPASSIGPAYSAIWHLDRERGWTFYVTVEPRLACPRYFGAGIERVVVTAIDVTWVAHDELVLSAPGARIEWGMRIEPSGATRMVSLLGSVTAGPLWKSERALGLLGSAAGRALGGGPIRLTGRTPNGQGFVIRPQHLWRIRASAAVIEGRELGPAADGCGAELGDFRLPATGLFAAGIGQFERFDPARHDGRVGQRVERA